MIDLKNINIITAMMFFHYQVKFFSVSMRMNIVFSWVNSGEYILNVKMGIEIPGIQ